MSNFTEICSLANQKKHDVDNLTQRHLLHKQFVAWSCNGSSVAPPSPHPLTEYMNNPIFQELPDEDQHFDVTNNDRVCLDFKKIRNKWIKNKSPNNTSGYCRI